MYSNITAYESMCELDAKLHTLETVSGHDIDTLISLFTEGRVLIVNDTDFSNYGRKLTY